MHIYWYFLFFIGFIMTLVINQFTDANLQNGGLIQGILAGNPFPTSFLLNPTTFANDILAVVDAQNYLTSDDDSAYLTIVDAANTYLAQSDAANIYETQADFNAFKDSVTVQLNLIIEYLNCGTTPLNPFSL
jgi:hypothetical protein